jgi:hypothetical protein
VRHGVELVARRDLGQAADFVIDLHAGEEKAVAATKTYTAELGAIAAEVSLPGPFGTSPPCDIVRFCCLRLRITRSSWERRRHGWRRRSLQGWIHGVPRTGV